ncbi:MAG: carboxypeptidase-like regulatory domain-containing protein [Chitinophagaceae bacterium]|nr:carboxypeptidase-like regulatory domain-containing protein [Chitinophagaceae bacterium]
MHKYLACLFWLGALPLSLHAQTVMKGRIRDFANNQALDNVNVRNIYSMVGMTTDKAGEFQVRIKQGELVEFSKVGYQTLRIRIQNEKEPSYYVLDMKRVPIELREVDIKGKPLDFKSDSMRYRQVYKTVLNKQRRNEIDMRSMPLAMLSRKNREEWAFQEMYEEWEQNKFIDVTFNEKLVQRITYLSGPDLDLFMKRYRPSYEFLRTASEYEYLDYIKYCFYRFDLERGQKSFNSEK